MMHHRIRRRARWAHGDVCGVLGGRLGRGSGQHGPDFAWNIFGQWRLRYPSAIEAIACSGPLLESTLYRRLVAHPHLTFAHDSAIVGLCIDAQRTYVIGVQLHTRSGQAQSPSTILVANLVVDASGCSSHAPDWLARQRRREPYDVRFMEQQFLRLDELVLLYSAWPAGPQRDAIRRAVVGLWDWTRYVWTEAEQTLGDSLAIPLDAEALLAALERPYAWDQA
jgi:hypothetical protein